MGCKFHNFTNIIVYMLSTFECCDRKFLFHGTDHHAGSAIADDDLNNEHMATALQVSLAVLPLTKIVNLLENPPGDRIR